VLPPMSAALRSILWTGVLLVVTLLPFLPAGSAVVTAGHAATYTLRFAPMWSVAIASTWMLASLVRGAALVAASLRLRRIWRSAVPVDAEFLPAPNTLQTSAGRVRHASLCLSTEVSRPSIIGFFSPRILIPAALYAKLSSTELDHIVLHEMEHLRRRDDWRNLVQKLALVIFPLNPALLWIDRRLAVERELACDESVLEATRSPKSYASCLVHLAEESVLGRHLSLALGAWERRSELARRVRAILGYRLGESSRMRGRMPAAALVTATLLMGAALTRMPSFVSFAGGSAPATVRTAAFAGRSGASYRSAALEFEAARPRMIEAVAHMPATARVTRSRKSSEKPSARPSRLRRVVLQHAAAKRFVLTSWFVSYAPDASTDALQVERTPQPQMRIAIFNSSRTSDEPQVHLVEALPTAGSIFIFQL
jgi:beta-lactamase regulating signal transducer with metallopeptidase domain